MAEGIICDIVLELIGDPFRQISSSLPSNHVGSGQLLQRSVSRTGSTMSSGSSLDAESLAQVKLLEIGKLQPGDFFGEIATVQHLKAEPHTVLSEARVELFL